MFEAFDTGKRQRFFEGLASEVIGSRGAHNQFVPLYDTQLLCQFLKQNIALSLSGVSSEKSSPLAEKLLRELVFRGWVFHLLSLLGQLVDALVRFLPILEQA